MWPMIRLKISQDNAIRHFYMAIVLCAKSLLKRQVTRALVCAQVRSI
jgi:hypothetical protein